MKKQTVSTTTELQNIVDNTFVYCKEEGKGFILRNLLALELDDYSFENVVKELEESSVDDLINLGMDPHIFVDGLPYQSQIIAKQALKAVEGLSGQQRIDALRTRYQQNRMMGFEREIPVYRNLQFKSEEGKLQFFTTVNLVGRKISVTDDNNKVVWSDYVTPENIEWLPPFRVTIPIGTVDGEITGAKINFFDNVVEGGIKNKKLVTPTITSTAQTIFVDEETTFTLDTPEENYKSIEWAVSGPYQLIVGNLIGSKTKTITVKGISASTISVRARLIGGDTIDKIHYIASEFSSSMNLTVQQPIHLPIPNFNISSSNVETGETVTLTGTWASTPYNADYEWDINGVNYTGTLTQTQIQHIVIDEAGQVQIRVRLVREEAGFINSGWSVVKIVTATAPIPSSGPMKFNDSNITEPPSFIEGADFQSIDPGLDTTDNISKYM